MTKVLITECSDAQLWYADKIGEIFQLNMEIGDIEDFVFVAGAITGVKKDECHIIEPWYEVAKQAHEQGGEVEEWDSKIGWHTKGKSWYSSSIYRLKPLPKEPEIIPYAWEDRDEFRNMWFADKYGYEFPITAITKNSAKIGDSFYYFQEFHLYFTNPDGSKIGKLKPNN